MTLAVVSRRLEVLGAVPLATSSSYQALRLLAARGARPVVAVIQSQAVPERSNGRDAAAVLRRLFSHFPDCEVALTVPNSDVVSGRRAVAAVHPEVATMAGVASTAGMCWIWLDRLFSRSLGDLALERGLVLHRPTLAVHRHWVGLQMVLRYPRAVTYRGDTPSRAARRFSGWLADNQSRLTVVCHGEWQYRLAERHPMTASETPLAPVSSEGPGDSRVARAGTRRRRS